MKKFLSVTLLFVALIGSAQAQVRKCTGPDGKVTYSDMGCSANSNRSAVNISGANITDAQVQASQERAANNGNGGGEACVMLKNQAQQTFDSFLENPNASRWNTSFSALQNLGNLCASSEVCGLIRTRIDHAQQRFKEDNKAIRGSQLNSVTVLFANACRSNGTTKQSGTATVAPTEFQAPAANTNKGGSYYTKDEFGTMVKSDKCFMTKDAFGVSRRSAGCAR